MVGLWQADTDVKAQQTTLTGVDSNGYILSYGTAPQHRQSRPDH
jgi:hypothetical protein